MVPDLSLFDALEGLLAGQVKMFGALAEYLPQPFLVYHGNRGSGRHGLQPLSFEGKAAG